MKMVEGRPGDQEAGDDDEAEEADEWRTIHAQSAEVFWAWASEATALERMERGWLDRVVPEWREETAAKMTQWGEGDRGSGDGAAERTVQRLQQRTLRALQAGAEDRYRHSIAKAFLRYMYGVLS